MRVKMAECRTDIGSIKQGDCFLYKGLLFMKIEHKFSNPNVDYAVNLATGNIMGVTPDTQVDRASYIAVPYKDEEKGKWDV